MPHVRTRLKSLLLVFGALGLVGAGPVTPETILGRAKVVDGDTLEVEGSRVRLFGIDAPELDQTCLRGGAVWACGREAAEQLAALVGDAKLECQIRGSDQYRRLLAVCYSGGEDVNQAMVEHGWALAYRVYGDDYVASEMRAKGYGLGIWSSQFTAPADFRLMRNASAKQPGGGAGAKPVQKPIPARSDCVIKGNRNRRGEWIYHVPGMPYYEQTRAEEIFCSEDEAWAAGYRRARVRS